MIGQILCYTKTERVIGWAMERFATLARPHLHVKYEFFANIAVLLQYSAKMQNILNLLNNVVIGLCGKLLKKSVLPI